VPERRGKKASRLGYPPVWMTSIHKLREAREKGERTGRRILSLEKANHWRGKDGKD